MDKTFRQMLNEGSSKASMRKRGIRKMKGRIIKRKAFKMQTIKPSAMKKLHAVKKGK
jgi:hypothetical protein